MKKLKKAINTQLKADYKKYSNASDFNNRKSYFFGKCVAYRYVLDIIKALE